MTRLAAAVPVLFSSIGFTSLASSFIACAPATFTMRDESMCNLCRCEPALTTYRVGPLRFRGDGSDHHFVAGFQLAFENSSKFRVRMVGIPMATLTGSRVLSGR